VEKNTEAGILLAIRRDDKSLVGRTTVCGDGGRRGADVLSGGWEEAVEAVPRTRWQALPFTTPCCPSHSLVQALLFSPSPSFSIMPLSVLFCG
jgi:hypothetical protein